MGGSWRGAERRPAPELGAGERLRGTPALREAPRPVGPSREGRVKLARMAGSMGRCRTGTRATPGPPPAGRGAREGAVRPPASTAAAASAAMGLARMPAGDPAPPAAGASAMAARPMHARGGSPGGGTAAPEALLPDTLRRAPGSGRDLLRAGAPESCLEPAAPAPQAGDRPAAGCRGGGGCQCQAVPSQPKQRQSGPGGGPLHGGRLPGAAMAAGGYSGQPGQHHARRG